MKKIGIVLGIVFSVQTLAAQTDTTTLSLDDAIRIALSESPTVKVADKQIERVEYAKKQRLGGLLPTVSLSGAYQRAIQKQVMFMDGGGFNITDMMLPVFQGLEQTFANSVAGYQQGSLMQNIAASTPQTSSSNEGITVGRDNTFTGGLSIQLPLIAPQLWSSLKMNALELELANETARSSKISLVNQIKKAYYNVLLAQDSYKVVKHSSDNLTTTAELDKKRFEQGSISEFASLQSEVAARNSLTTVATAEMGINLSLLQLKAYMGVDLDLLIGVEGSLPSYEQTMYGDILEMNNDVVAENTSLKQLDIQAKQLEQTRKMNLAGRLPTLGAQFEYNYMSMINDDQLFTKDQRWLPVSNLSLGLSIPLFSGGSNYYQDKQLKSQKEELALQRESLVTGLQTQFRASNETLRTAALKITSSKESLRQADKAVEISRRMYEVGAATFLDLSNAELLYQNAGLGYAQAVSEYLNAKADLELLLGKIK
ncbi:MAG: TolC family protein [Prevotellaceae bacterium]|nr:TolC family protein [Prevotellaceae bacterium]